MSVTRVSENTNLSKSDKKRILDEVAGVWSHLNENLAVEIETARTTSDKNIFFQQHGSISA